MTRVWFGGPSWCPRHGRTGLILQDKKGKPVLQFQMPAEQRNLVLDEMARARNGCCSTHRLLLCLLRSLQLDVQAVVFDMTDELATARIDLGGDGHLPFFQTDPLDALILAVSLSSPIYVKAGSQPVSKEINDDAYSGQVDPITLPEAFSQFIRGSEAFKDFGDCSNDTECHREIKKSGDEE